MAELAPVLFGFLGGSAGPARVPPNNRARSDEQMRENSLALVHARHLLEQVFRDDDVIHMTQAVLHLGERTKVRLRVLFRVE